MGRNTISTIRYAREMATELPVDIHAAVYDHPKGAYQCLDPKCTRELVVCRWPKRPGCFYFRHRTTKDARNCGFHTSKINSRRRHDAAVALLAVLLNEAIHYRRAMPVLEFLGGMKTATPMVKATQVIAEWCYGQAGRRPDIALLDRYDEPVLLVEVFHTHAVDRNKEIAYSDCWWLEVEANAIIANPERLPVRHCGNLPPEFMPETLQRSLPGMHREW